VDALGNPLRLRLTAGQRHDITQTDALIEGFSSEVLIADAGYDAADFIASIEGQVAQAMILSRKNRTEPRDYDAHLYRERHLIECFINKIKQYRRVFSRFEKLSKNYLGFLSFVSALVWLR
jgi:transposase